MRPADLQIAEPQGMHHLRGAGNEGDDSHLPNIALAILGCRLLFEHFFELAGLLVGFSEGRDIQEADLELEFGSNVHDPLYRSYDAGSIDTYYLIEA
jgi:hypothetical protein